MAKNVSLLGSTSRLESPTIKVTFGDKQNGYTFGVFQASMSREKDGKGYYKTLRVIYPNYVQSLEVQKINGQVNQYTLQLIYPITQTDDPNFFEKVFSSVSKTRKITFTYGDASLPTFIYKDEEAIITDVKSNFNISQSTISYTVSAVSSAALATSGTYTFINMKPKKPSDEIKRILYNSTYGLTSIFYGMTNRSLVEQEQLIASDDKVVQLESRSNVSVLEYLSYLVSCMVPSGSSNNVKQNSIYILSFVDDTTGVFGGPYFKVTKSTTNVNDDGAYEIDIGFPTANIVTEFRIDNNENYSILYDWQNSLDDSRYVRRLNNDGKWEDVYAPNISSKNEEYKTRASDMVYWTKITEYPISASITIKGLLRPAILMTKVRLNVYFFGKKHISSGLYIVTKQVDRIDMNGYRTTLNLTRIRGDE